MKQFIVAGFALGLLVFSGCSQSGATVQASTPAPEMQPMAASEAAPVTPEATAVVARTGEYVYVCNQTSASVSVIDVETLEVVDTVELSTFGFDKNAKPHHIAVEADGAHWYVSLIGANRVLKFNNKNELVGSSEFQAPGMLSLHPDEDLLFVGRSMMAVNPPERIGMIEPATMEIEEVDVFFPRPHALIVDPRGDFVYSGSLSVNQFLSMNIDSGEINLERLEGNTTHTFVQFAVSPDGSRMVVGGQMTGQVFIFDTSNPEEVALLATVKVNGAPWHPTFTPDGRFVYFGNKGTDTVTVLDVEKQEVATVIEGEGLSQPHGIAISKDGSKVFVSNNNLRGGYKTMDMSGGKMDHGKMDHGAMNHDEEDDKKEGDMDHDKMDHGKMGHGKKEAASEDEVGTLVVIDTATNKVVKVIALGFYPSGVGTNLH